MNPITPCYLLSILIIFSLPVQAEFDIRKPCVNDDEISQNTGALHKYYASMLAFNSEPPRCLHSTPIIPQSQVNQAVLSNDPQSNDVIVDIQLSPEGTRAFADYTGTHLQQEIALLVDNKILAMLTVLEPITTGVIQIRGLWYEDAVRLANAITASSP